MPGPMTLSGLLAKVMSIRSGHRMAMEDRSESLGIRPAGVKLLWAHRDMTTGDRQGARSPTGPVNPGEQDAGQKRRWEILV